jgi:hypothetical protein
MAREDRRAGEVVAMLYNINRDRKKDPKGWTWLTVFPEHQPPVKHQSEDEMFANMMQWARARPATN